jgi:class 3 adenylate cyclase/CHASE3 domain sensor protein
VKLALFRTFRRLRIPHRLAVGFGLLIFIFLAYGLYSVANAASLADETAKLHSHPLVVQREVLEAEFEIVKIHRAMKDVVLAGDDAEVRSAVRLAEASENVVDECFELLRERFLGDPAMVDDAYTAFLEWRKIRAEVVELKKRGDDEAAATITRQRGARRVALLEEKMDALRYFASRKADEVLAHAREVRAHSTRVTYVLLAGLLLLGSAIAWATSRSIQNPLRSLTQAAERITEGDCEHRVTVLSDDELGTLADAFNVMVENITAQTRTIQSQNEENERLLLNVLPAPIADRLKQGEKTIADSHASVSVLFADLCGFTELAEGMSAAELVGILNEVFSGFDESAERCGVEKIKTVGDGYMAVSGLLAKREDHAGAIAMLALEMLDVITAFNEGNHTQLGLRIGISSGPVLAGVIGRKKFIYDLWGDTVNTASRMESEGAPGEIQISSSTYEELRMMGRFEMESRGVLAVKGKGSMETYMLSRASDPREGDQAES